MDKVCSRLAICLTPEFLDIDAYRHTCSQLRKHSQGEIVYFRANLSCRW